MSKKKSAFTAKTTVPSGSTFDFVYDGTNYKITDANLITALGATGTIVQDGASTGVPVLDIQGTVHNIRNLEVAAASGLSASVSAENGITLELNAQSTGSGTKLLSDSNKVRRLIAGDSLSLSVDADDITINYTGASGGSDVTTGIAAFAGGGQASATELTTKYNQVSTVATAGDSIKLPEAVAETERIIINNGANYLDLYPATGDKINGQAVNTAVQVNSNGVVSLFCVDATNWWVL